MQVDRLALPSCEKYEAWPCSSTPTKSTHLQSTLSRSRSSAWAWQTPGARLSRFMAAILIRWISPEGSLKHARPGHHR